MSKSFDVILKNGWLVDPLNNINAKKDIGIKSGKIASVSCEINPEKAKDFIDIEGSWVFPGIIDLHVHASSWLGGKFAHRMMAMAGVTTALDMSGPIESVLDIAAKYGAGLNLASIQFVRPGHTVRHTDPSRRELENLLFNSLEKGAIGLKILGGHYPLTPTSTALAVEIITANDAYVALHAGTTEKRSNIEGFLESVELINGKRVHLAHINSYCRGNVNGCRKETEKAISTLIKNPNICSESYLSSFNGTSAKVKRGLPESEITAICLDSGGFEVSSNGLESAIMSGWAKINVEKAGFVELSYGKTAVDYWRQKNTDVTVSFKVNPDYPRLELALARKPDGEFVVDCISTDGGGIPRNVTVDMGLSLVRLDLLSLDDFVIKTSSKPAKILGLINKGNLGIGTDADVTVVDRATQKPVLTMVDGKIVMYQGLVFGKGCNFITTSRGEAAVKASGVNPKIIFPGMCPFFQK